MDGNGNGTEKARYPPLTGKRPNYRPTPLRWPFIACVAAIISVLIALVIVARERMPGSDADAQVTVERRDVPHVWVRRSVIETRLLWEREEIGDGEVASIEANGTPVVTLPPEPAPELKATLAAPTPTQLPDYLRPGLDTPGQVVIEVPLNPCGGAKVCTTMITTDVISQTIIQPPELSESIVTVGSTTEVSETDLLETVVVGGTPVTVVETVVTQETFVTQVTVVQEVTVTDEPLPGPSDGDGADGGDEGKQASGGNRKGSESSSSSSLPTSSSVSSSSAGSSATSTSTTSSSSDASSPGASTTPPPFTAPENSTCSTETADGTEMMVCSWLSCFIGDGLPTAAGTENGTGNGAESSTESSTESSIGTSTGTSTETNTGTSTETATGTSTGTGTEIGTEMGLEGGTETENAACQNMTATFAFPASKVMTSQDATPSAGDEDDGADSGVGDGAGDSAGDGAGDGAGDDTGDGENDGDGDGDGGGGGAGAEPPNTPPFEQGPPNGQPTPPLETEGPPDVTPPPPPPPPPGPTKSPHVQPPGPTKPPPDAENNGPGNGGSGPPTKTETSVVSTTATREFTKVTTKVSVTGGQTFTNTRHTQVTNTLPVTTKQTVPKGTQTYFSLGPTTIQVTYTPDVQARGPVAVTRFTTTVEPAATITGTIAGKPVAVVKTVDEVRTQVLNLAPQTFVSRLGPKVTSMVITVTPTPGPTPGIFKAVSLSVVSNVGGTFETTTVQDAPRTVVTNVNGVDQTILTTPPPRTVTNQIGGTLSTFELITTPTSSNLLTFTVVTTLDGELTTIVTTPSPSTIVTTISGKLTTITSTPTSTFTSVSSTTRTIADIITGTPGPSTTTVPVVYDVNEAEYFLGKFLPALLAVLLAIVLRIVDLNAKLYQPFYALNQEGGALGANSMTLHYSGIRGFVVPFLTLFQGHPVPFITTMIVWCSSLMVPLSTEGLGLKLHGKCTINDVTGCAADLGISPGPTHALLALMALIVMLLLVLIFFLRNWETGLYANPWSVAGITSLSRSRDVRIRSSRKETIRKEMAEKKYSFGWFRNSNGNDEYGIILHDEAGRFLAQGNDSPHLDLLLSDDSDDDFVHDADRRGRRRRDSEEGPKRHVVPFIALSYPWRIAVMFFLGCLFVLILYYHITRNGSNDFTLFMKSQSFGVRFLFAGIGVVITFAWVSFFVSKCSSLSFLLFFPSKTWDENL